MVKKVSHDKTTMNERKLSSASPSSSSSSSTMSPTQATMEPFATHLTPSGFPLARMPKWTQSMDSPPDCLETDVDGYVREIISTNPNWMSDIYDKVIVNKWTRKYGRDKRKKVKETEGVVWYAIQECKWRYRQWRDRCGTPVTIHKNGLVLAKDDGISRELRASMMEDIRRLTNEDEMAKSSTIAPHPRYSQTVLQIVHPSLYCYEKGLTAVLPGIGAEATAMPKFSSFLGAKGVVDTYKSTCTSGEGAADSKKIAENGSSEDESSDNDLLNFSSEDEGSNEDFVDGPREKKGRNERLFDDSSEDEDSDDNDVEMEPESNQNQTKTARKTTSVNESVYSDESGDSDYGDEDSDDDDDDVEMESELNQYRTKAACKNASVYESDDSDESDVEMEAFIHDIFDDNDGSDDSDRSDMLGVSESSDFQWLPSEFFVSSADSESTLTDQKSKCHINSYINNLHPYKYKELYDKIGQLFVEALPLLEELLTEINGGNGKIRKQLPRFESKRRRTTGRFKRRPWKNSEDVRPGSKPMNPGQEPRIPKFKPPSYTAKSIPVNLHDRPLQVIVKIVQWNLTPDNRELHDMTSEERSERLNNPKDRFGSGHWHVEGTSDERIVASACCYLDANNVSESKLEFRDGSVGCRLGEIATTPGKIIVWPNYFHHRTGEFGLKDGRRPGSRTLCCFHLIDPTIRIRSTATVPPQQQSWILDMVNTAMSVSPIKSISSSTGAVPSKILSFMAAATSPSPVSASTTTAATTSAALTASSASAAISNDVRTAVHVSSTLTYASAIERRKRLSQERRAGANVIADTFYECFLADDED